MLKIFLLIIQSLWPYIKKALLEDGTFRDWVRRNVIQFMWFCCMLTMFTTVLWLLDLTVSTSSRNKALREENVQYEAQILELNEKLAALQKEHTDFEKHCVIIANQHDHLDRWLQSCGIDYRNLLPHCPAPVVKRSYRPPPSRKPLNLQLKPPEPEPVHPAIRRILRSGS